mmetsp:Transcript_34118/g.107300  ORF Transcript_34118/g.107300 Transcript_34118/m.107300 type:complete len:133 (-) Transcript_34118:31-429(-)
MAGGAALRGESAPGPAAAPPPSVGARAGMALIELPESFATAPTAFHELASSAADADPAAVRSVRLQWLRVQEDFARAEAEALEPRADAMRERARRGDGGGLALEEMSLRLRQLSIRLASLKEEKRLVKRGLL